jgi:hypothetical protein
MNYISASVQAAQSRKGFAMLFAVLVSSVLLSIGASIFNLTLKELILSSSGRESQFAFYAADTGIECALYWDFKAATPSTMFATSSESVGTWRNNIIDLQSPAASCVGIDLAPSFKAPLSTTGSSAVTRFELTIPNTDPQGGPAPYCAIVTVTKSVAGLTSTVIESRGYNTACDSNDQSRIERALKVTYEG